MVSPPTSKAVGKVKLPKRLQENVRQRREAALKRQTEESRDVKGKLKVNGSAAPRNVLKIKNQK